MPASGKSLTPAPYPLTQTNPEYLTKLEVESEQLARLLHRDEGDGGSDDDDGDAISELLFAMSDYAEDDGVSKILDVDVDSVSCVAGKSVVVASDGSSSGRGDSEELPPMHLADGGEPRIRGGSDTLSVRVSRRDVDVRVGDGAGVVEDIDLTIEIPRERLQRGKVEAEGASSVRRRMRRIMRRLRRRKGQDEEDQSEVVVIRDTISVRGEDGRVYDLEMDLRVEVDQEEIRRQAKQEEEKGGQSGSEQIAEKVAENQAHNGGINGEMRSSKSCGDGLNKKGKKKSGRRKDSVGCLRPSKSLIFPRCPALGVPWRRRRRRPDGKLSSVGSSEAEEMSAMLLVNEEGDDGAPCGSLGVVCGDGGKELAYVDDTPRTTTGEDEEEEASSHRKSATELFRFTTV